MERRKTASRLTAYILVFIMAISFMPVFGLSNAYAASSKGRLVKKVTVQSWDKDKEKWVTDRTISYTYNKKGDPTKIKTKSYDSKGKVTGTDTENNKYSYTKKKVRKARTMTWKRTDSGYTENETEKWKYDKKGNPKKVNAYSSDSDGRWKNITRTFVYTKKGWYLSKEDMSIKYHDSDEEDPPITINWKYTVKQKSQLLKSFIAYKVNDDNSAELEGSFTYTKKGFLKKAVRYDNDTTETYAYKMKKGRVSSVKVTLNDDYGKTYTRYKFSYTKKKANKIRYAKMINEMITYGDYAYYPWY